MLPTTLVLLATSFIAVLAVPLQERSTSDILADIADVTTELNAIESDLNGLESTDLSGLNDLEVHTNRLISDLQKAAADVDATGTLSEADGQNIAAHVRPAGEELIDILNLYVTKKPVFEGFANTVPNVISDTEETLENIAEGVDSFISGVLQISPSDVVAADGPLRTSVAASLATAVAAFQS